jgi:mono/diheme cytochrome c family protein
MGRTASTSSRILIGGVVAAVALLAAVRPSGVGAAEAADGQALFLAQKCNTCHGVSSAGIEATTKSEKMKGPDLAGVVAEKGEEWTGKYLRKEIDLEGKKHGKEVKLSPEEMARLLAWLKEQKKPA